MLENTPLVKIMDNWEMMFRMLLSIIDFKLVVLLCLQLSKFILPVIHGFIEIQNCSIKNKSFNFILISRRSCYRAGMASHNVICLLH